MSRSTSGLYISLALAAGCVSEPDQIVENPLGIAELQVEEGTDGLTITGVDPAGQIVGRLQLEIGTFLLVDDTEGTSEVVFGRQLHVDVLGQTVDHESEGTDRRVLPPLEAPEQVVINQFLYDARVRPVLERWEIGLEDPVLQGDVDLPESPASSEVAYDTCALYPPNPSTCAPIDCVYTQRWAGQPTSCKTTFDQLTCCNATHKGVSRKCGYSSVGLGNPCGPEGAGGCAVCWSQSYTSLCDVSVSNAGSIGCCPNGCPGGQGMVYHNELYLGWSHN